MTKILIIRRDNIGDLVCTTPLLHALRKHFPKAHLSALVNSYNARVLKYNPDMNGLYVYTKLKHRVPGTSLLKLLLARLLFLYRLRRQRFDYVVIAGTSSGAIARVARLAQHIKARHVIAFTDSTASSPKGIDLGVPYPAPSLHEVEATFSLLAPLSITGTPPNCRVYADTHEVNDAANKVAAQLGAAAPTLIGIQLSSRKPVNRWPAGHYVELMKRLHNTYGVGFLLLWAPGTSTDKKHPGDDDTAACIKQAMSDIPVVAYNQGPLGQLIADLSLCQVVISSDGGAMHLAAALEKPLVCFFGDAEPSHWRPWHSEHLLLQSATGRVCDISVDQAYNAFDKLYRQDTPTSKRRES